MSALPFNLDQQDALHEVANVAMGQAGSSLARMLDTFVNLSVPRSRVVAAPDVIPAIVAMVGEESDVTVVRQGFCSGLMGEALVIFAAGGCPALADLLGHDGEPDECAREELALDISNLLVGAVLTGLGDQIGAEFRFSPPSLLSQNKPLCDLLMPGQSAWEQALLIEVNFSLEARDFRCHMVLLMPGESIERMRGVLDRMLAEL